MTRISNTLLEDITGTYGVTVEPSFLSTDITLTTPSSPSYTRTVIETAVYTANKQYLSFTLYRNDIIMLIAVQKDRERVYDLGLPCSVLDGLMFDLYFEEYKTGFVPHWFRIDFENSNLRVTPPGAQDDDFK
jgi:hypothetical protein